MAHPGQDLSTGSALAISNFKHPTYVVRRKIFKLFGGAFHIYDPMGNVAFYSEMKAFKLKEDIRLYTGEDKQTEILTIKARNILDISATYDVFDPRTDQKVGALRRKGLKSMLRDEWLFLDNSDQEIGKIEEDSMLMAVVRRLLMNLTEQVNLIPQSYQGEIGGAPVCTFKQNFNPFVLKVNLDFSIDQHNRLDRRLGIAAAVLLCAIEGRQ
ncbi:MAG TPA: hypothetical protein VK447_12890 [Myxococcaceae bacterium]|nr:hypothetical protein [Myxococcaceae bacterium]